MALVGKIISDFGFGRLSGSGIDLHPARTIDKAINRKWRVIERGLGLGAPSLSEVRTKTVGRALMGYAVELDIDMPIYDIHC